MMGSTKHTHNGQPDDHTGGDHPHIHNGIADKENATAKKQREAASTAKKK
jgi:hypothetical protein